MKTLKTFVALLLLALPAAASECSTTSMILTGSTKQCSPPYPHNGWAPYPLTTSATYEDKCINNNNSSTYMDVFSTANGNGYCGFNSSGAEYDCPAVNKAVVTHATSNTDYNRFYNYMYDTNLYTTGIPPSGWSCWQNGAWRQDYHQCAGIACTSGCGGGSCGGGCGSPIIIDTRNEGFHLTSATEGVNFDLAGTGKRPRIAWTDARYHNAFLALDRNGNGRIDSGKELFGNFTQGAASEDPHDPDGFAALAEYDKPENGGNGDGMIDSRDAVYSRLLLWIDENHDGVSQPSELHHLREMGVLAISLNDQTRTWTDAFGNSFRQWTRLGASDRVDRIAYDVWLQAADPLTAFGRTIPLSACE